MMILLMRTSTAGGATRRARLREATRQREATELARQRARRREANLQRELAAAGELGLGAPLIDEAEEALEAAAIAKAAKAEEEARAKARSI